MLPMKWSRSGGLLIFCSILALLIGAACVVVDKNESPAPPSKKGGMAAGGKHGEVDIAMVKIPAGEFTMGIPDYQLEFTDPKRDRLHLVKIDRSFSIGVTEVTQTQWEAVMGINPARFKQCSGQCPVEQISWYEAIEFANRLSAAKKLSLCYRTEDSRVIWDRDCEGFRLPTEAEWEYAARAATPMVYYSDLAGECLEKLGWCNDPQGLGTHPVASLSENPWGLYDVQGNVAEWVWDWQADYPTEAVTDPMGPEAGFSRVVRGGSWSSFCNQCLPVYRSARPPDYRGAGIGLRIARNTRAK